MPAVAMADIEAVVPQAAKHNHDRDVRLEHLRKSYYISTSCYGRKSGLIVTPSPCKASIRRFRTHDASGTNGQPGVISLHV